MAWRVKMPARSRQLHKRIMVAVLVVLLGVGLFGVIKAYWLWHHLSSVRQHLRALDGMVPKEGSKLEGLVTLYLQAVGGELSGMREDVEAFQAKLDPFLLLPVIAQPQLAFYFCFANATALAGFYRYATRSQPVTWEKVRP
jgi:hypothetical protein